MVLLNDGLPTQQDLKKVYPGADRLARGPVAILECFQNIPCDRCFASCPYQAVSIPGAINDIPVVDTDICNGCCQCLVNCPGLAIFVVDMSYSRDMAAVMLPYEYFPLPSAGDWVYALNRRGERVGQFQVEKVQSGGPSNKTYVVAVKVPKDKAMEVRNIVVGGNANG